MQLDTCCDFIFVCAQISRGIFHRNEKLCTLRKTKKNNKSPKITTVDCRKTHLKCSTYIDNEKRWQQHRPLSDREPRHIFFIATQFRNFVEPVKKIHRKKRTKSTTTNLNSKSKQPWESSLMLSHTPSRSDGVKRMKEGKKARVFKNIPSARRPN